jgi:hypothetical protein
VLIDTMIAQRLPFAMHLHFAELGAFIKIHVFLGEFGANNAKARSPSCGVASRTCLREWSDGRPMLTRASLGVNVRAMACASSAGSSSAIRIECVVLGSRFGVGGFREAGLAGPASSTARR